MEIRLKHLTSLSNPYPIGDGDHGQIKPEQYRDEGIPYIRVQNLSFNDQISFDGMVYISEEVNRANSKSILRPNDILVAKTGATIGKAGVIPESIPVANTTSSVGKITIDLERAIPKYVYYCIASDPLQKKMWEIASTKSAQPGFNIEDIKEFKIFLPDYFTQNKIVVFLDKKINAVNEIIKKETTNIENLRLFRKACINDALTKGISKECELKPSGIDWMGMIKKTYVLKRMKYVAMCSNGLTYSPNDIVDDGKGTLVLRSSNIQNGKLCFEDNVYVNKNDIPFVKCGDTLICSRNGSASLIGKNAFIMENNKYSYGAFMMIARPQRGIDGKYLFYLLNSNVFEHYLSTFLTTTINQLTKGNFNNMVVPVCLDINEQKRITIYLELYYQ